MVTDRDAKNQLRFKSPSCYGIIGISGAITLDMPLELSRFQYERKNLLEFSEILANNKISRTPQLGNKLVKPPNERNIFLEEQRSSYMLDYAYSRILDFTSGWGEAVNWKDPWTERTLRINRKESDSSNIFNTFLVSTKFDNGEKPLNIKDFAIYRNLYVLTYDVMLLVALRQWEMFLDSYLFRIYDIFLPPAKISKSSHDGKQSRDYFIAIPYVSIRRKSGQAQGIFSRTVSISLINIPTTENAEDRRNMDFEEMHEMTLDETKIILEDSPLRDFIKDILTSSTFENLSKKKKDIEEEIKGEMPLRHLFKIIALLIFAINSKEFDENKWSLIANRLNDSFQYSKLLVVDDGSLEKALINDITKFYKEFIASDHLRALLNDLVAPNHNLNSNSELDVVDFRSLTVNEPHFLDNSVKVFYNPFEDVTVVFLFSYAEKFPKRSIKWGLSWYMRLIQSLSILISIKNDYYYTLERSAPFSDILSRLESDMLRDLDDFYDLEIRTWAYSYRQQFKQVKKLLGIDVEFERLREKASNMRVIVHTQSLIDLSRAQIKLSGDVSRLTWVLIALTITLIILSILKLL
ncbi:hypothetical protein ACNF42_08010 [Cuniculiplasma sp. SKW3]|uniref:hypothetical protein n=1 Tax=Cuniculiplasma sp. SKW3 TaxID=3400170 RepID=UPI003FD57F0D